MTRPGNKVAGRGGVCPEHASKLVQAGSVEEGSRAKIWNLKADIGQLKVSEGVRQKHVKLGFRGAGRLASSQERS